MLGAVMVAVVARGCEDELLWVDGRRTTCAASGLACEEWFCAACPYAGACDAHCGLCAAGACDGVVDCGGRCVADSGGRGDGCCDRAFDCERHDRDGGDCERPVATPAPGSDDPRDHDWCVLLTATVCPHAGATHVVRTDPFVRRRDYAAALRRWVGPNGTALPLAVVENSGANLDALRAAAGPATVDFVSFSDAGVAAPRGKGHGEARAIQRALAASPLLKRCARIAKVTGRYFLEGLDAALAGAGDAALVVQSSPSPWTMWDGVLRSEVVGFANDAAFVAGLFDGQDERAGRPMERVLFVAARRLAGEGVAVASLPPLAVPPTPNAEETHVVVEL